MKFPNINPAEIAEATNPVVETSYQLKLIESIDTAKRLVERFIVAKARAQLAHDSWRGILGRKIPCGGNKREIPGGWIGTGGPRLEPPCQNCQECYNRANESARGAEIALQSMIDRAVEQQADLIALIKSSAIYGVTLSGRRGTGDIDSRYGGYHD